MKAIQAIRGMNDLLPDQSWVWEKLEAYCREISHSYGYQEIRTPLIEQTQLFKRTIGEATDIVEKEMYTFEDRNGDSLSLRPEGTASCVRAGIEHGLLYNQIQRLWYIGPMFRHERPQKGRYRQFYQFGIEAFGMAAPEIDVEIILLSARLWKLLGINHQVTLEINSLGTSASRQLYRDELVKYFHAHLNKLTADEQQRLQRNPLRLLDSKNPELKTIINDAPRLDEYLDEDSQLHFARVLNLLGQLEIPYVLNPRLVRGLDYYDKTVFEWVTHDLGAQGTICAGGRYDQLVTLLGGKPTPAVGFALGLERLALLLAQQDITQAATDIYLVLMSEDARAYGLQVAERLRNQFPQLEIVCDWSLGGLKAQLKRAANAHATWAILLGDDEVRSATLTIKQLASGQQSQLPLENFMDLLNEKHHEI